VPAVQSRLWPDARPLVERLGASFFRTLPTHAGVYLLRDDKETVLYVGKAKNLRRRLGSYRVANPDRLPRRLLRLLHLVRRIEWQPCADEAAALARESELLLSLKPRFNRAGVWTAPPRFLAWRVTDLGVELAVTGQPWEGWEHHGPMGQKATHLRVLLVRLLWCAFHPERGIQGMPAGWYAGHLPELVSIPWGGNPEPATRERLRALFADEPAEFLEWMRRMISADAPAIDRLAVAANLESLTN
jgi:predicted GIY-YIG superfamily endonuclease